MEHPDKDQIEYEEKIREYLNKWFQMNRSRLTIGFVFSLIGYIVLYLALILAKGIPFANEYILEIVITLVAVEGISFIGYVFWLSYRKIPQEIDKEKDKKIKELENRQKTTLTSEREGHLILIPVKDINTQVKYGSVLGFSYGIGIEVHNDLPYEITECFGTLESVHKVSIENGKLIYSGSWLKNTGLNSSKRLSWANSEFIDADCKISIPAKSLGENVIFVSSVVHVAQTEKKGKAVKVKDLQMEKYVIFNFCETTPNTSYAPGLFKVKVRVNGKVSGKPDIVEYFEGYGYSYITEGEFDIYWSKDPLKDQRIIKDPFVLRG